MGADPEEASMLSRIVVALGLSLFALSLGGCVYHDHDRGYHRGWYDHDHDRDRDRDGHRDWR